MTLAWLQLSYRQTEAYSFSTETTVAFITAKIVTSLRDTACCHRNRRFQLQKAVTFCLCARAVYFSAIGTKAFCACAALESPFWFVTFWPDLIELIHGKGWPRFLCFLLRVFGRLCLRKWETITFCGILSKVDHREQFWREQSF